MTDLWDEWERITRFLESARVAFARERATWESLGLVATNETTITARRDQVTYTTGLTDHLRAIADEEILHGAVLVNTYALTQWAAAEHLGTEIKFQQGIETWGEKLLVANDRTWDTVRGGLAGIAEAAVARNAFAHGVRQIDEATANRLERAGARPRTVGSSINLTYAQLRGHRLRLRSLLHQGGLG